MAVLEVLDSLVLELLEALDSTAVLEVLDSTAAVEQASTAADIALNSTAASRQTRDWIQPTCLWLPQNRRAAWRF